MLVYNEIEQDLGTKPQCLKLLMSKTACKEQVLMLIHDTDFTIILFKLFTRKSSFKKLSCFLFNLASIFGF